MTDSPPSYFDLSKKDKFDALEVGASKLGRPAHLLEKDIWVVWALHALFDSQFCEHLVFKGGTSLSKVHGAIDRFSEDVDVTHDIRELIPDLLAKDGSPLPANPSQTRKWTKALAQRLPKWIETKIQPMIQEKLDTQNLDAKLRLDQSNLYIDYEAVHEGSGYVKPTILLEFGARSTGEPAEFHEVACDLANAIDDLNLPSARPKVMKAERTFWEKATAIHVYCSQGKFRGGDRYARHWYDLDCLDQVGIAQNALDDRDLARQVAVHKQIFFRELNPDREVIDYTKAVSGGLCIVPTGDALEALRADYAKMEDDGLFQSDPVSFDILIRRLGDLEARANA